MRTIDICKILVFQTQLVSYFPPSGSQATCPVPVWTTRDSLSTNYVQVPTAGEGRILCRILQNGKLIPGYVFPTDNKCYASNPINSTKADGYPREGFLKRMFFHEAVGEDSKNVYAVKNLTYTSLSPMCKVLALPPAGQEYVWVDVTYGSPTLPDCAVNVHGNETTMATSPTLQFGSLANGTRYSGGYKHGTSGDNTGGYITGCLCNNDDYTKYRTGVKILVFRYIISSTSSSSNAPTTSTRTATTSTTSSSSSTSTTRTSTSTSSSTTSTPTSTTTSTQSTTTSPAASTSSTTAVSSASKTVSRPTGCSYPAMGPLGTKHSLLLPNGTSWKGATNETLPSGMATFEAASQFDYEAPCMQEWFGQLGGTNHSLGLTVISAVCGVDGQWNSTLVALSAYFAPGCNGTSWPTVENATFQVCPSSYNNSLLYTCSSGLVLEGSTEATVAVTCTNRSYAQAPNVSATNTSALPRKCIQPTCSQPPPIVSNATSNYSQGFTYPNGSIVTYTCLPPTLPNDTVLAWSQCIYPDGWSQPAFYCVPFTCNATSLPPAPANGRIIALDATLTTFEVGTNVTYGCQAGFEYAPNLQGEVYITCQFNIGWSALPANSICLAISSTSSSTISSSTITTTTSTTVSVSASNATTKMTTPTRPTTSTPESSPLTSQTLLQGSTVTPQSSTAGFTSTHSSSSFSTSGKPTTITSMPTTVNASVGRQYYIAYQQHPS